MELIDIGANLAHDSFDQDRDEVLSRAWDAGVSAIVLTGSSEQSNADAARLATQHPGRLFSTAGVHPHHASEYNMRLHEAIRRLTVEPVVVAVGECGLDYFRNFSPRDAQRHAFEKQLELAQETGLPVFLHQRDAHEEFVEILEPRLPGLSRAVAHCFTGDEAQLARYLDMGLYIGITGWICDERRGAHLQDIVGMIPEDRLMIETDAPYLLPRSLRPKPSSRRNEPAFLREVLRVIANARGQSEEAVAAATTATARRFFELPRNEGDHPGGTS
jgi:TatD DNase family protein